MFANSELEHQFSCISHSTHENIYKRMPHAGIDHPMIYACMVFKKINVFMCGAEWEMHEN
jgi:hypothetical protein